MFASYLIRGRPLAPETAGWLEHFIRSSSYLEQIGAAGAGIGMQNVNAKKLAAVGLPLPPANEQKRIVAKIEELTARSRRAKEALDAVPPLLDKLRQSILAAAFRGDLTADWRAKNPNVEPADQLLARIRAERRARWEAAELAKLTAKGKRPTDDRWKAKYPAPAAPDTSDMPDLPEGWSWLSLAELSWDSGYGTSVKCSYEGAGEAVLRIPNIAGGAIDLADVKKATSDLGIGDGELLGPGDLLVVRTNGSKDLIGRAACVEAKGAGSFFASYLIRFRLLGQDVLWRWVSACWRSQWIRSRIESTAATSAGQYNISLSELAQFAIPIPPLGEQAALMEMLSVALARLDRLDAIVADQQRLAAMTDQSILARAFRGELVPQDRSDEPASVLLERIRTTRGGVEARAGSRRRSGRAEAVVEERDEGDADDGSNAPASLFDSTSGPRATKDISELDQDAVHDEVFAALWAQGPLEKDDAVLRVAEHLRDAGFVAFQRLRADGPLYAQLLGFVEAAVKAGRLDRPKRGQVRACKPDAATFTADDWRHALIASLGIEPTEREESIRVAAEWARDHLGLEFSRLRSDGHIVQGLRSAINSAIRRGDVVRHGATHIARAAQLRLIQEA